MRDNAKRRLSTGLLACLILAVLTGALTLWAMKAGSLNVTWRQLISGLFVSYDETVRIIYDLRFPRILIALLAGAALSASGLILQAVLKNPLADPGIIGISGGAGFAAALVTSFFPMLYFFRPIFACVGGLGAFLLIYTLAWKGSLNPVRILLVGVAIAAVFSGLTSILGGMNSSSGISLEVSGLSMRTWSDVRLLAVYSAVGLIPALVSAPACNLMALDDRTIRSLGTNADRLRALLSLMAVWLVSSATAVIGVVGFLALLAPHMGRKLVGGNHWVLTPFCILLGAFILLLADTLGRLIAAPYEVPASVIMSVVGGPCFVVLLRKGDKHLGLR
ncbi:iron complex transport system permease protein [Sporobacter termitidis DSM 10068]|uniref:Probable heme-iron transport system permease protein IsdF n=1 Tax=Sporobacter termitidis DSM 10068 TaxID=1123282 RepID=A0A1M5WLK1_9FIRM|nr:iron ABC transporter permease [Sporobacter termitidis]SHH88435.1 iron complex transport system permease protein [Sporobacter termitidis DSM 10068]